MSQSRSIDLPGWLSDYRATHQELLDSDAGFCRWLEEEYVPIGGGWQY